MNLRFNFCVAQAAHDTFQLVKNKLIKPVTCRTSFHRGNSRYKDETAAEEMLRGPRYGRCEGNSSPAEGRDTCRNQVYLTFNSDLERCW
jgi:hypothetical protein